MQLLRKQLEESRQKEEMESCSRANLEELVAGLQRELEERDMMIANLNLSSSTSSVISSPFVMSPHGGSPGDSPGNSTPPAGKSDYDREPFGCTMCIAHCTVCIVSCSLIFVLLLFPIKTIVDATSSR